MEVDQTDPEMGAVSPDVRSPGDETYSLALEWVENVAEVATDPMVPPTYIVRFADLVERAWGWKSLVPYKGEVKWCDYKNYLAQYFTRNAGQIRILCGKKKPETVGEGVAAKHKDLHAAAKLCIKLERQLLKHCNGYLNDEEILLSESIRNHAKSLSESEGEPSFGAACLVCIAKEAELVLKFPKGDWKAAEMITFANQIRLSASKIMHYKGSKSADAIAGALLGSAIEAQVVQGYLTSENPSLYRRKYRVSQEVREYTAELLTKLEKELAQETHEDEEKSKSKKRKKSERKETLPKKVKLNGGNETKLHTGATVAVTEEHEVDGQLGRNFSEDLKVFVGNLPFSVDCEQLMGIFKAAGSVKKAQVICDKWTGRSRGYGFVTMPSVKEFKAALEQFDGYLLDGRTLRVNPSNPSVKRGPRGDANKVIVDNLPLSFDKVALTELFSGQGEVLEASIAYD